MKKRKALLIILLSLLMTSSMFVFAADEDPEPKGTKAIYCPYLD
jgi:hypothetical protein